MNSAPLSSYPARRPLISQPDHNPEDPIHIDAADARGADVVLRKKRERWIFFGGLVGIVLLLLIPGWFV